MAGLLSHGFTTSTLDSDTHQKQWRKHGRIVLVALASLACVACGHDDDDDNTTSGGGDSGGTTTPTGSSGGGSTNPTTTNSPFAGNYAGTVKLTATSKTLGSTSDSFPLTASINDAGVMVFRSEQVRFTTTVNSNGRFSRAFEFNEKKNSIRCIGTLNINGRITRASGVMDGNVSGPLTCRRGILKVSGDADGSFNARRN